MQIYLDESADGQKKNLLLGALFVPDGHGAYLYHGITEARRNNKFDGLKRELKYTNCIDPVSFATAKEVIDLFLKSTSFFRLVFLERDDVCKENFGLKRDTTDETLVEARIYKKFAELLISQSLNRIHHGGLYCDELQIGAQDKFIEVMRHAYTQSTNFHGVCVPTLGTVEKVRSDDGKHPMMAMTDLLMGCVLNANTDVKNQYKIGLKDYLKDRLNELYGIRELTPDYWQYSKSFQEYYDSKMLRKHPKFSICFWKP